MGTVGDALDNAMCESLIGTMKIEKLNRQPWRSVEDVRAAVFDWIETWYNRRRRHSSLGYLPKRPPPGTPTPLAEIPCLRAYERSKRGSDAVTPHQADVPRNAPHARSQSPGVTHSSRSRSLNQKRLRGFILPGSRLHS